jgi:hypothetical protein
VGIDLLAPHADVGTQRLPQQVLSAHDPALGRSGQPRPVEFLA